MGWQDRPYSGEPDHGYGRDGLRSWFGGLPPAGRVVKWIALANVAMFLLCQITGGSGSVFFEWLSMRTDQVLLGQVWRLLTFTYVHDQAGLGHIFWNMLGLYFLGTPLERHWGPRRFFTFYTIGGLAAVSLYVALTVVGWLDPFVRLIGASGGVLAVLGACAVLFPQFRLILVLFPVPIRTAALIFVAFYAFNLLNRGMNAGGDACHLAGLAFGIYWGYRGQGWLNRWSQWHQRARRGAWETKRREELGLEEHVDQILDKVKHDGINSLTRREKKLLEEATRRKQARDRQHGF